MDVQYLVRMWLCLTGTFAITVSGTVDWVPVTTIQDVHSLDRLTTIDAFTVHNCAAECYALTDCICMGYSYGQQRCQLYDKNLEDFGDGLIAQGTTILFRAACSNNDYTYVRPLGLCLKLHKDLQNLTNAMNVCQNEDSILLMMDTARASYLTKLYPHLGGTNYLVNGELVTTTTLRQVVGGSTIIGVGDLPWLTGQPNIAQTCITVSQDSETGAVGLQTSDCTSAFDFFCGHSFLNT